MDFFRRVHSLRSAGPSSIPASRASGPEGPQGRCAGAGPGRVVAPPTGTPGEVRWAGSAGSRGLSRPAFPLHCPAPLYQAARVSGWLSWGLDGSPALAELSGNLETNGMQRAPGSGKPSPARRSPSQPAPGVPGLSQKPGRLAPRPHIRWPRNVRAPLAPSWAVPGGSRGGWRRAVASARSGKNSPPGLTYHMFFPKAKNVLS